MSKKNIKLMKNILIPSLFLLLLLTLFTISSKAEITYIKEGWIKEPSTNESLISTYTNNHINNKNKEITISKKSGFDSYSLTKQYDRTQIPIRYYKISYNETSRETTKTLDNKLTHYINLNLLSKTKFKLQNLQNPMDYEIQIGFGTETYTPSEDTIYIDDGSYTLNDIYEADLLNGWNEVFKHNSSMYSFECNLQIGNGTYTTLNINEEHLLFNQTTYYPNTYIKVQDDYGSLYIDDSELAVRDCSAANYINNQNYTKAENSTFYNYDTSVANLFCYAQADTFIMRNCLMESRVTFANGHYTLINVINSGIQFSGEAIYQGTFTNYMITDTTNGLYIPAWQGSFDREVYDLILNNCEYDIYQNLNNSGNIHNLTLTDLQTGRTNNEMRINYNNNPIHHIHRNFTFNLDTTPSATVKLYDVNGNLIVDTTSDANGDISEYSLLMATYGWDIAGADGTAHRRYYPYRLVISKDDYITYNQTFNNSLLPVNYNIQLVANDGAQGNMIVSLETSTELFFFIIWIILFWLCFSPKHDYLINVVAGIFLTLFSLVMFNTYTLFQDQNFLLLSFTISVIAMFSGFLVKKPLKKKG